MPKPIAIYFEQAEWWKPLFAELDQRGTHYVKVRASEHAFGIEDVPEQRYALVLNRMSASAANRNRGDCLFYTLGFLEHLEARGVRVIDGVKAFRHEISKAAQLVMLDGLGLAAPRAKVIHRAEQALAATKGLRWPVVVKPNLGGGGAGVRRFDAPEQLKKAADAGELAMGPDATALVQEYIPARGKHIVRVEVLNGKYLYALKIQNAAGKFDVFPADGDGTHEGAVVEAFEPEAEVIADVERIVAHAGIELGSVEYLIDDRDGQRLYFDVNALSQFVADGPGLVGFDPYAKLADWLEDEAERQNAREGHVMAGSV